MRFIGKRLGLIIWAVVVILILAVPLWRLRAGWQWQSPFLFDNAAWYTARDYGLTGRWEREAVKRFPDNPTAQIAPLSHPNFYKFGQTRENQSNVQEEVAQYFARYDAFELRFPLANVVRAQRLRDVTRGQIYVDIGPQPDVNGVRFADSVNKHSWLDRSQLEKAIESAREGARLEPDNAFFPWMEAILNFSLKRDNAAIAAMKRAGQCTRFDDYVMDAVRERLVLLRELRSTGWEDDFAEFSGALLPHYARMRNVTRAVMARARLARKRGDEMRALELAGITQRAGAVVERADGLMITKLVGREICLETWKAILEKEPKVPARPKLNDNSFNTENSDQEAYSQQIAQLFANYARGHKRPDLAAQALVIAAKFDARQLSDVYKKAGVGDLVESVELLAKASWVGSNALVFGVWASLVWALMWPFSRRAKDAVARRQSLLWAMFLAGITVVLFAATLRFTPQGIFQFWNSTDVTDTFLLVNPLGRKWLALLWIAPTIMALIIQLLRALSGVKIASFKRSGKTNWLAIGRSLLQIGFVVGWVGVALGIGQPDDSITGQLYLFFMALWLGCAFIGSILMLALLREQARVLAFCAVIAFWAGLAPSLLFAPLGDGPFYGSIAMAVAITAGAIGLLAALRVRKIVIPRQKITDYAFQFAARTRIAAGVLALLCAIAYFGITLWTIPVERGARSMMQRQLQIGEIAWLREQMRSGG